MMNRRCGIGLVALLTLVLPAEARSQDLPTVALRGTEVRELLAEKIDGMVYHLYVAVPEEFTGSEELFPAVYLLDSWNTFGTYLQTYRLLRLRDEVPPLILVGVAYGGDIRDHDRYRSRDFMPTHLTREELIERYGTYVADVLPETGGAASFLDFLQDELIPFVEAEYPVDSADRGIFGYSAGGLFAFYALVNAPTVFQKYMVASSAVWYDDYAVFEDEERYAEGADALPARVYLSVGGDEYSGTVEAWERTRDLLESRGYRGLEVFAELLENETHISASILAVSRAFRRLYGG